MVRKVDVVPARRLQKLHEVARLVEAREPVPCGGFSTQYACMCDYHNLPYRDEVAWVGAVTVEYGPPGVVDGSAAWRAEGPGFESRRCRYLNSTRAYEELVRVCVFR